MCCILYILGHYTGTILLLFSVYSPFSDMVGLPLHNIPSPFLPAVVVDLPLLRVAVEGSDNPRI